MSVPAAKESLARRVWRRLKKLAVFPLYLWRMKTRVVGGIERLHDGQEVLWQRIQHHLWDIQEGMEAKHKAQLEQFREVQQVMTSLLQAAAYSLETQQAEYQADIQRHTHLLRHLAGISEGLESVMQTLESKPAE